MTPFPLPLPAIYSLFSLYLPLINPFLTCCLPLSIPSATGKEPSAEFPGQQEGAALTELQTGAILGEKS